MTKRKEPSPYGYPVDKNGKAYGPECYDNDVIPSLDEVRASHSPGWVDARLAKAREARLKREKKGKP